MDEQIKVCPSCDAEYYAHITECRGCGIELADPNELEKARGALAGSAGGSFVCVMQGPVQQIKEIAHGMKAKGFDARVLKPGDPGGCSSSAEAGIFVEQSVAHAAVHAAEELRTKMLTGLVDVNESYAAGRCPACGADIMSSPNECPDCGLNIGGMPASDDCDPGGGCGTC